MSNTRNQHYIPRSVLRGFLARKTKRDEYAWTARRSGEIFCGNIEGIGAQRDFYSRPSVHKDDRNLDKMITEYEARLSMLLRALRDLSVGDSADSSIAAEVIGHLTPRAASLRTLLSKGVDALVTHAESLFTDEIELARILGLESPGPTDHFVDQVGRLIRDDPRFTALNIPAEAFDRIAFALLREGLPTLLANQSPGTLGILSSFKSQVPGQISEAHRRFLQDNIVASSRINALEALDWRIMLGEGAILPDCVAVALHADGSSHPYIMSASRDEVAVLLPLTPAKILVGLKPGWASLSLKNFNKIAAACSDEFIVSATRNFEGLVELLGTTSGALVDETVSNAVSGLGPPTDQVSTPELMRPSDFSFDLGMPDWDDADQRQQLTEALQMVVEQLAHVMPLHRLAGLAFATNLEAELTAAHSVFPEGSYPRFLIGSRGVGASYVLPQKRNEGAYFRIVMAADLGWALTHQLDDDQRGYALHVLVEELAICAFLTELDERWPGVIFMPMADTFVEELFSHAAPGLIGYIAARSSANFGGDTIIETELHDLLRNSILRGHESIAAIRANYSAGNDIAPIFQAHRMVACELLILFGRLAGHMHGQGRSVRLEADLQHMLEVLELKRWFELYAADLDRVWSRRSRWTELREITSFGSHLERLLWQLGIFLRRMHDGQMWVELIPSRGLAPAVQILNEFVL